MDVEIPQLLGVSKAVLENVIFCHQEDSYWPLSEPSILKKKFDEIFEATKYTKALDNIKALRKDRAADLKAEHERLSSLKSQKDRFDKLRLRMRDLTTTIATKEGEYDTAKAQHEETVESNRKFYEYGTKFREIYLKVENLEEKRNGKQKDLEEARDGNFQEIAGNDEDLQNRLNRFDAHIDGQKQKLLREERNRQDYEDELGALREQELKLSESKAYLEAEAQAQTSRLNEREQLIHEIGKQFGIGGVSQSPLDKAQVNQFLTRIADIKRKQTSDIEKLQNDITTKTEEFNTKLRKLDYEAHTHKAQKNSLRDQLNERNASIKQAQRQLENQSTLHATLESIQDEMKEKQTRIEKVKRDISVAQHDKRLQEKTDQVRILEEKRESLMEETRALSTQADSRAKLDLKRSEVRTKNHEIQALLRTATTKFEDVAGHELKAETAESDVDRLIRAKDEEQTQLDREAPAAKSELGILDAEIQNLKTQISNKQTEAEKLNKFLNKAIGLEFKSLDEAIRDVSAEVDALNKELADLPGMRTAFEAILKSGKDKHVCLGCNRSLKTTELKAFEDYLRDKIKKAGSEDSEKFQNAVAEWSGDLKKLQDAKPYELLHVQLVGKEIPALKAQLEQKEAARPELANKVELLADQHEEAKSLIKTLAVLKQQVSTIVRLRKDVDKAESEIGDLETDLSMTGGTKTVDDVQLELNDITAQLYVRNILMNGLWLICCVDGLLRKTDRR
ncbi:hypothetical protein FA15DRAFT_383374 [Coprinopsis marcescibilis]|uniref:Uncharacterized protein n=1 Tax=Coprinopsis marcescibilis TaxID=230819 RepID=A0A5C3KX18_COPMA|nr:hypothetical protein FA15DRAFT_383374 [Coprinopsis marcescibilis]